jgi:hypothetical protein
MNTVDQFKYYQMILETRDAYFYHGTRSRALESILSNNTLMGTTDLDAFDVDPEMNVKYEKKGAYGTVSVARDLLTAKRHSQEDYWHGDDDDEYDLPCVIVLNQQKLKQDIGKRIRPSDRSKGYTEEKIYGDIQNIRQYIVSVLIYNTTSVDETEFLDGDFNDGHPNIKKLVNSGIAKFVK